MITALLSSDCNYFFLFFFGVVFSMQTLAGFATLK